MLVLDFVTIDFPAAKLFERTEKILQKMVQMGVNYIPLTFSGCYKGLLSKSELEYRVMKSPIISEGFSFSPVLTVQDEVMEALDLMTKYKLDILPIVEEENRYKGCLTREGLLKGIRAETHVGEPGSIICVQATTLNYSQTDLIRALESNHAHLQSMHTSLDSKTGFERLTLKIDLVDITHVSRSLERFGFEVTHSLGAYDARREALAERANELSYIINM
ncbi:MAG: CBS domain-containing protein [Massilibacteroides sp.]|nr:CBS domain-containing protein [Massilibacteroides sp.]